MSVEIENVKQEAGRIARRLGKKEILAIGLFGSLTRGEMGEKSDIDVFVITENEISLKEQDELYFIFSELIPKFGRDITLLVYDLKSLKKIPSWQTLNLVRDAHFVYDRAEMNRTFERILQQAEKQGIFYDAEDRVFRLKRPKRLVFSLKE